MFPPDGTGRGSGTAAPRSSLTCPPEALLAPGSLRPGARPPHGRWVPAPTPAPGSRRPLVAPRPGAGTDRARPRGELLRKPLTGRGRDEGEEGKKKKKEKKKKKGRFHTLPLQILADTKPLFIPRSPTRRGEAKKNQKTTGGGERADLRAPGASGWRLGAAPGAGRSPPARRQLFRLREALGAGARGSGRGGAKRAPGGSFPAAGRCGWPGRGIRGAGAGSGAPPQPRFVPPLRGARVRPLRAREGSPPRGGRAEGKRRGTRKEFGGSLRTTRKRTPS